MSISVVVSVSTHDREVVGSTPSHCIIS